MDNFLESNLEQAAERLEETDDQRLQREEEELKAIEAQSPPPQDAPEGASTEAPAPSGLERYGQALQGGLETAKDALTTSKEMATAPAAGVVDTVIDSINALPKNEEMEALAEQNYQNAPEWAKPLSVQHYLDENGNIPHIPKFQSELAQSFRDLSSILIPTFAGSRSVLALGNKAAAKYPLTLTTPKTNVPVLKALGGRSWNLSKDKLVKKFGEISAVLGVDTTVGYIDANSAKDHNFFGSLKKAWPRRFGFIDDGPDGWATNDADSEDLKRKKTIKETVGVGIFGEFLFAGTKLAHALKRTNFWPSLVPRNSKAQAYFDELSRREELVGGLREDLAKAVEGDDIMDVLDNIGEEVYGRAKTRDEALEELKSFNRTELAKAAGKADKPMIGPHDSLFEPEELGTTSPNPGGVVEAMVGAARIQNNRGTWWGRVGTIITEGALKLGLRAQDLNRRTIVNMVKKNIQESGEFDHIGPNAVTTWEEIDRAGTVLAEVLYDSRADRGFLVEILDEYKNVTEGIRNLNDKAYNGVMKAMNKYLDDYLNMDTAKAQAYLATSMAGEISDIAEGARLMQDTEVIGTAQEQILDRLEYLLVEKGLASYLRGAALNHLNMWKRFTSWMKRTPKEEVTRMAREAQEQTDEALSKIIRDKRQFVDELRHLNENHPEYLKPLLMFWEISDGNIDSMYKMSHFVKNKLGVMKKAVIDMEPGISSDIMDGLWGIYYNSMLSSIVTVQKAGLSNMLLTMEKPIATLVGAATMGDMDTIMLGWHKYNAVQESLAKGIEHMKLVYRKSAENPHQVPYTITEDLVLKGKQNREALDSLAAAEKENGHDGIGYLVGIRNDLEDLQADPRLRFGVNGMSAIDGFGRAMLANAEARGRSYMDMFRVGNQPQWNPDMFKEAADKHYNEMFDSNGFITDKAVDYQTREMGMNLDNRIATGINGMLSHIPGLRPFMMFARTSMNVISAGLARTPMGVFHADYAKVVGFGGEFGAKRAQDFSREEVAEIFKTRGIPMDDNWFMRFKELRAEYRGRVALGTTIVSLLGWMALNGKLNGDGHYDRQVQKVRDDARWARRSFQDPAGNWHSFKELGPWADVVAGIANHADNFDLMSETHLENAFRKYAFVIGSAGIEGLPLMGLEPLFSIVSGDEGSWNRWLATSTSALFPWSGTRNDLSRLISPSLKEMDNETDQHIRNRNGWADLIDPEGQLPELYDYIDGGVIGHTDNLFVRVYNALTPFKVTGDLSDRKKFLIDIEFDSRPSFIKGEDGIEYTNEQRSELMQIMGRDGYFRDALDRIMAKPYAKEFAREMRAFRKAGYTSEQYPKDKYNRVYAEIVAALQQARNQAERGLTDYREILIRRAELRQQRADVEAGRIPDDVQAILDEQQ